MASRKKRKSRTKKQQKKLNRFKWKRYLVFLIVFCLLPVAVYYVYQLDQQVREQFEGNRWTLPARVYAQSHEIYLGQPINKRELIEELNALGYTKAKTLKSQGYYKTSGQNKVQFYSRSFVFWDKKEDDRKIEVEFANNSLISIVDLDNRQTIPYLRLEPRLIGKIYPEHNEDRILIAYKDVPPELVEALIATEDHNFYSHFGIDPKGIARAMWTNLKSLSFRQGGSTLTQQLVKNFYLSQEKTLKRKFNEFLMALILEHHYSKREILSAYINEVYLGQDGARGIHGFGTAAEFYFARPLEELTTDQIALLVGMVKGASYYNPRKHPQRAKERRNLVLNEMFELNMVDDEQLAAYKARSLTIQSRPDWSGRQYLGFIDLLKLQLRDLYSSEQLRSEGLRIFTTLNASYQNKAQQIASQRLSQLEQGRKLKKNSLQTAVILTSTDTGEVLAVVSDRYAINSGFNRVISAKRPIGSLVKPAVYLTAMQQAEIFNPLSMLDDSSIRMEMKNGDLWQPENYDKKQHGQVPAYLALSRSYNLATVNLGMQVGLKKVIKTLHKLGIQQDIPEYPSLLLGAIELSPFEVAQMYQTIASGGFYTPLNTVREILDKHGNPLKRKPLKVRNVIDAKPAYLLHAMLTEVFKQGTAAQLQNRLADKYPLAGKTGTTDELRDSWFAAYGSNLLAVSWVGRDDNESAGLTGSSGAMQIWADMMQQLPLEPLNLVTPEGIKWARVRPVDGQCQDYFRLPFIDNIPEQSEFICRPD